MKKIVYFERLFFYHLPLFFYHILRKDEVIVFDLERELIRKRWLVGLHDRKLFRFIDYYLGRYASLALDVVETVYKNKYSNSSMIKAMVDLYDSDDIAMAYKKELAKRLSIFYAMQIILEGMPHNRSAEKIILYDYRYRILLKSLKENKCFCYDIKHLRISSVVSFFSAMHRSIAALKQYSIFIFITGLLPGFVGLKGILSKKETKIKEYCYLVPIFNFDFQFKFKSYRTFDFLLDHREIRKDNTLFLIASCVKQKEIEDLKSKGYNFLQCDNIVDILKLDIGEFDRRLVMKLVVYYFKNIPYALFQPSFYLTMNIKLVLIFVLWNMILSRFRFNHLISSNEHGETHLGRNLLLDKHGCRTWSYAHSNTFGFVLANKDLSFYDLRNERIAYLYYDSLALWNNRTISFFKLHPSNKINNYFNIGCIWSESVLKNISNDAQNCFGRLGIDKKFDKEYKIASFFSVTYSNVVTLEMGIDFYKDVMKLLSEETRIFVIIKEKKEHSALDFSFFPSRKEYFALLDELSHHPRCLLADPHSDSSDIIAISDLTVSHTFTSSPIEAIGARKRAFFYDPGNCRLGFYYDKVPGLIVHGYKELKEKVNQLLFETSDEDYDAYLNKYILSEVENYLDGKAITRFQRLLIEENPGKVLTMQSEDLDLQKNLIKKT